MHLQKEWASFRITLLLYMVILVLPLGFYFVHTSFKILQADTQVVRQSSGLVTAISQQNPRVDTTLKSIVQWAEKQDDTELYIGVQPLSQDLAELITCTSQGNACVVLAENLAVNIEKMVYLKQKKIMNWYYAALALVVMLVLLMIYFVRVYIRKQMKKHSMHDHDTGLFNKKFFMAELHATFDRADRTENPLSLLSASFDTHALNALNKKAKKAYMKELGEVFTTITRVSDIVCRYDVNHLVVLLPLTEAEEAHILEGRLEDALENHDFKVNPKVSFNLTSTQTEWDETEAAFLRRAL